MPEPVRWPALPPGVRYVRPQRAVRWVRYVHVAGAVMRVTLCGRVGAGDPVQPGSGEICPRCLTRALNLYHR